MRRSAVVILVVASFVLAPGISTGAPSTGLSLRQETGASLQVEATPLALGEAFSGPRYDLVAHAVFIEASPDRVGYSEVRVGTIMRNTGSIPILYSDFGLPPYLPVRATLVIADQAGTPYPPDFIHPDRGSRPGSELESIQPGLSARWTFGFQVPTSTVDNLELVLRLAGQPAAVWDLNTPSVVAGFGPPAVTPVQPEESFPWQQNVRITAKELGSLVCGDPEIEPVAHIVTVTFEVSNLNNREILWPGTKYPDVPAIAQWSDGSAARFSLETFVGNVELLPRVLDGDGVAFPPAATLDRAFVFAAPRDGRMVDVGSLPQGVLLNPPEGEPLWLDLTDTSATVGIDPAYCDLGFLGAPIPYAFGPSPRFFVGGEGPFPDIAALDADAQTLLRSALAAAGLYYDDNGQTFEGVSTSDLEQYGPNIEWVATTAGTDLSSAAGQVYWDALNSQTFFVITESGSEWWFCATTNAYAATVYGDGSNDEVAGAICAPEAYADEA